MRDETRSTDYQRELFDRLKKSIGLQQEEACFGACLKPASWWLIEKPHPTSAEVKDAVGGTCARLKRAVAQRRSRCSINILSIIKKSAKTRTLVTFDCREHLRGFVYPICQGDKLYGYIGACYAHKDVSPEILGIFTAFTDAIIREVQKELELSKLYETIRPRAIALSTVHTVYRLISSTLDLNELLPRIARLSLQILRANRCSIKLTDAMKKVLLPKATVDLRQKKTRLKKVKIGRWAPGKAVKYGRPIRGENYIATPLIDEDVIGVITLYDKLDGKPFNAFDQEIMTTLAEQAVIAIKNAQLYREQEKLVMGVIKSLATILGTRAHGTHVPRAAILKLAMAVGQELRLDGAELKSLQYATLLHDAGQIVVPDNVLTKPTSLTGEEYEIVKGHPAMGVQIIRHIAALKSVVPIILYHHENYDGSGYPKGLKKDHIPLAARIMAVISSFDAMTTKRPYRSQKSIDDAIDEIKKHAGTQFDPAVVNVFLSVIGRHDMRALLEREIHGHL